MCLYVLDVVCPYDAIIKIDRCGVECNNTCLCSGGTSLMVAACKGDEEMLDLLLEHELM